MAYEWKILGLEAPDGELISEARYHVELTDGGKAVATEGNWYFREPTLNTPFDQVTEEMVIAWIKDESTADGKNQIEARLLEQMFEIQTKRDVVAPWEPQIFTPVI